MNILIVGATSAMAYEAAKCFAAERASLFLVARNIQKLSAVREDLLVRGAQRVETFALDMTEIVRHQELLDAALSAFGDLDMLLLAYGTLEVQRELQASVERTLHSLNDNFVSPIAFLTIAANYFEARKSGCIAIISSVAGDRGRQANYVYGAAKGGLHTFAQGLRNRLFKSGVRVLTIKPGPVDTPMTTTHMKNPLFISAERAGTRIYRAMKGREDVIYVPWFWREIMTVLISLPEIIFKRTNLKGG
ncbi:MAG TPA: SDR family oxidoreductase [Aggregatilineales bacterium]|nr:SDR family oxidoreductase [Aggregatilineales bacterium]